MRQTGQRIGARLVAGKFHYEAKAKPENRELLHAWLVGKQARI